jgi:hypothetical protein
MGRYEIHRDYLSGTHNPLVVGSSPTRPTIGTSAITPIFAGQPQPVIAAWATCHRFPAFVSGSFQTCAWITDISFTTVFDLPHRVAAWVNAAIEPGVRFPHEPVNARRLGH